jgi:hypothetical protein
MTKTRKYTNKNKNKNITHKNRTIHPDIKILQKDFTLYGAKNKKIGFKILDYTKLNEIKKKKHCVYENISWFAGLEQAKHYKGKKDEIFKWNINKKINPHIR